MKTAGKYAILIHGGAGTILREHMNAENERAHREKLTEAVLAGEEILKNGGSAVDAVEASVKMLEDSPLFNAGKGSVFTHDGKNEMDASIMDGSSLAAGAVLAVQKLKNPVAAARKVMEYSEHVMLAGKGAELYAQHRGCELVEPTYFFEEARFLQLQQARESGEVILDHSGEDKLMDSKTVRKEDKFGTVGAVALDFDGNLAAATSTGGMTNKRYGRVGDSPVIGAGTYANNSTCAVSCTGHGEFFLRNLVAYDVAALMEYKSLTLREASEFVVHQKLKKQGGEGGLIALDADGNYCLCFNTPGMYRGVACTGQACEVHIYQ